MYACCVHSNSKTVLDNSHIRQSFSFAFMVHEIRLNNFIDGINLLDFASRIVLLQHRDIKQIFEKTLASLAIASTHKYIVRTGCVCAEFSIRCRKQGTFSIFMWVTHVYI